MSELPNKALLRPDEVAAYLQVSRRTVYLWIDLGKMEAVRLPGGGIRVKRETVIETLKAVNE